MPVKVLIPTPLRRFTGEQAEVEVNDAATVAEALSVLIREHDALKKHLFDDQDKIRSFVNVYVNDDDIRYLDRERTSIKEGDTLSIVPSIAGGAAAGGVGVVPKGNGTPASAAVVDSVVLDQDEIHRYSRHLIMPEVGMDGQKRLKAAKVLCVGAGGLGAPLTMYLAAAGIGRIGLVEFDVVDVTNLQRQLLYSTRDVGRPKLEAAAERLRHLNPHIEIAPHPDRLTSENALDLVAGYDMVVDGTDNFPTRYLVNDACVLTGKPNVYGSIFRFEGQLSVFSANAGPCYRCLFPTPPPPGLVPSCAEGGVLGVLPGIIGSLQALEAIKLAIGAGDSMIGRLLLFDALALKFRELKLRKNPECPICGPHRTITKLVDYDELCGIPRAEPAADKATGDELTPREVKAMMNRGEPFVLLDVRNVAEWNICRIEGARLIPLDALERRISELDTADKIVVHCRSGVRSRRAVATLRDMGFTKAQNMAGGILRWTDEVDPSLPKY
ncbi:MAG: molybdopterin-synthase adenylyltransferase MoeB [Candidatus Schekmanbacteria bacterium]|nr:molybdopterin-synthase adenylyltransferase MoeB [Candidatus Schekmanbacteria bacterium]